MDRVVRMPETHVPPSPRLSSVLRDLMRAPRTLSPEEAAGEAADRIIAAVEGERGKERASSN